ncbi:hypothetical protein FQZ97_1007980 [compost metagenome]
MSPNENPENMALMARLRTRAGAYSDIKVTALGIAAPRPRPVIKRRTVSSPIVCARADNNVHPPNHSTDRISNLLRP